METTPRPIPVTATPQRRGTMNTDAFVRTVVTGRARRMGIVLVAAAIITGPLAYTLWWYMSQGWRQQAGSVTPAGTIRAPAALQPPGTGAATVNPARAPVADAAPPHVYQAPVVEPAPVAAAAERAREPARAQNAGHRGHAERSPAQPGHDAPGVGPATARSEDPTQPPALRAPTRAAPEVLQPSPEPASPDKPKKRVRHFDDNPYGE
jgi:hypothetical protein